MTELSASCFYDTCQECRWGLCRCDCHMYEEFDLATRQWYEPEDDDDGR